MAKVIEKNIPATKPLFTVKRKVTVPTMKIKENDEIFVRILGKIEEKPSLDKNGAQKVDPETGVLQTINVARVEDLTNKEISEIVLGLVPAKNLRAAYPDHAYEGLCFRLLKKAAKEGKRAKEWEIDEIEDPEHAG